MSLSQGSDAILNQKLGYQAYNRLKNHFVKPTNPGDLQNGMIWFDSATQTWFGKRTAGYFDFTLTPPLFPEGMIIPWSGGYFTDGANGGYTRVLGATNDAAGINALLNAKGWYVCNGAALNIGTSTIYNGAGRYLPNLTDDRFLMGDNLVGVVGGSNSSAHTHAVGTLVNAAEAAHAHAAGAVTVNAEAAHTHGVGSFANAAEAAHTHGNGTLAVDAAAAHDHAVTSGGTDNAGGHDHSIDPPNTTSSAASAGTVSSGSYPHTVTLADHTHDVDIAAFNSSSVAAHWHSITINCAVGGGHGHTLSGATAAGSSHNHAISGSTAVGSSHAHTASGAATGAGSSHNHAISGDTGAASATENRPAFLSIIYLQYVLA